MADTSFDPDQYLKEKVGSPAASGGAFNPDQYLKEKTGQAPAQEQERPWYSISGKGLVKGALNALPTIGMVGGGAMGVAGGPAGIVGGAGAGSTAGESLKQSLNTALFNEGPKTREEQYSKLGNAALSGAEGEMGGQALGAAGTMLKNSPLVQKGMQKIGDIGTKLGETLTGVSKQDIKTYANNADEIKGLIKESAGSIPQAADDMRDKWMKGVQAAKGELNSQISKGIEEGGDKSIDSKSIVDAMEAHKARLNPKLTADAKDIKDIDELIGQVKGLTSEGGTMTAKDANDLKRNLQDVASPAYQKPGQIFNYGEQSQQAAKKGAAEVRSLINKEIPEVASANNKLAQFHDLEDDMNKNLLASGKPEASVLAAGSGGNARNAMNLEKLGKLSDQDLLPDAQKLSAMRQFNDASWNPIDSTGKSLTRAGKGAALGGIAGYGLTGNKEGAMTGALAGGLITSPAALKSAIDSGLVTKDMLSQPGVYNTLIRGLIQKQAEEKR